MDGVIVDSTRLHTAAWDVYLRKHGLELADVGNRMLGKHNDAIVGDFFSNGSLTRDEIVRHGAGKEAVYRELMRPVLVDQLVPGIREFLESFHGDIEAAVATNAEKENVDFILDGAGLRKYFACVLSGHDVERPKPAPDIYLRAAEELQADPACCIVFEDSLTGVTAERAAGMHVAGVQTTLTDFPNVDIVIGNFRDPALFKWLERLSVCA